LTVLAGLAEFERELIRARTSEGRARQGERGRDGGEPLGDSTYNVSRSTISRLTA
jgi:DNA invertase Pin-like site-specific DNA recombinase